MKDEPPAVEVQRLRRTLQRIAKYSKAPKPNTLQEAEHKLYMIGKVADDALDPD